MGGRESCVCRRLSTRCCALPAKKSGLVERTDGAASTRGKSAPPPEARGIDRYRLGLDHWRGHPIDGCSRWSVACDGGKSRGARLGRDHNCRPPGVESGGGASVVGPDRATNDRHWSADRSRATNWPGIDGNRELRSACPRGDRGGGESQKSEDR